MEGVSGVARPREVILMNGSRAMDGYLKYLNSQLRPVGLSASGMPVSAQPRVVTISRQAGAGAHAVAEALVNRLQPGAPKDAIPWTIFDRNLVEKVLADHDLPEQLARFMPEDRRS